MIHAHRPTRFQCIYIAGKNNKIGGQQTTTTKGCLLLFFDEARIIRIRNDIDCNNLTTEDFIAQALETYCGTIEQAFSGPQPPRTDHAN